MAERITRRRSEFPSPPLPSGHLGSATSSWHIGSSTHSRTAPHRSLAPSPLQPRGMLGRCARRCHRETLSSRLPLSWLRPMGGYSKPHTRRLPLAAFACPRRCGIGTRSTRKNHIPRISLARRRVGCHRIARSTGSFDRGCGPGNGACGNPHSTKSRCIFRVPQEIISEGVIKKSMRASCGSEGMRSNSTSSKQTPTRRPSNSDNSRS